MLQSQPPICANLITHRWYRGLVERGGREKHNATMTFFMLTLIRYLVDHMVCVDYTGGWMISGTLGSKWQFRTVCPMNLKPTNLTAGQYVIAFQLFYRLLKYIRGH